MAFGSDLSLTHRIDACVQAMQVTALDPSDDRSTRESEAKQLHPGDHPVLTFSQIRNRPIRVPTL
jgi:hypothetical protein